MPHYSEFLAMLFIAVIMVWVFKKLNLPAILAYLFAGMVVGEHGLFWAHDQAYYDHFAELGIVFLLFTLGLEFSLPKLIAMKHLVLGVGSKQVLVSIIVFFILALLFGQSVESAFVISGIIALSSTAIVVRTLSESGAIKRKSGQISIAVLLFQDVAVVPLLIIIPLLAGSSETSMLLALIWALVKGVFVVGLLMIIGKRFLPKVFNLIAVVRSDELFVLSTLLVTLLAATLTQSFGLSMALGAFLAGMMLGESEYKHQLEADIRPYRDILLGLFFITVGMKLDVVALLNAPFTVLGILVAFMAIKILIVYWLARQAGERKKDAWASGIMLAQMGEFGFVLVAMAAQHEIIATADASILLGAGVISMAMTPFMIERARGWALALSNEEISVDDEYTKPKANSKLEDHVIICGFGRVGQTVSRFLKGENIPFIAIDIDPLRIKEAREAGENVIFGSSRQHEILSAAGLNQAKLVVVAFGEDKQSIDVITKIAQINPNVRILVRTRNDDALIALKEAGATEVVPEILEGSLMLVSQVLNMSGVPVANVLRRIQSERRNHYHRLHGFYQGEDTDMSPMQEDTLEFMHATLLTDDAHAAGKSIGELKLDRRRVEIKMIRRGDEEIENPDDTTVLKPQDTLVLFGKPRRVERAERYLLEGA